VGHAGASLWGVGGLWGFGEKGGGNLISNLLNLKFREVKKSGFIVPAAKQKEHDPQKDWDVVWKFFYRAQPKIYFKTEKVLWTSQRRQKKRNT